MDTILLRKRLLATRWIRLHSVVQARLWYPRKILQIRPVHVFDQLLTPLEILRSMICCRDRRPVHDKVRETRLFPFLGNR